jgi:hypothetical protein
MKSIRVGGASGFWGDSFLAAPQLVASGSLQFLVFDYLAEITMSILAKARAKNPEHGYALDFVDPTLRLILPACAQKKIRIVSNAGGIHPQACARHIESLLSELGLSLKVAVVTGDDMMARVDELRAAGTLEMSTGEPIPPQILSMNAYLGAFPIARALNEGADIVITGRCVDSAVTLGPCIHAFGWSPTDWDQLAGGSLAGHILECGAQATGGLLTDWKLGGDWANIGYPIAEVFTDGTFEVSKPPKTGGIVSRQTIAEQLVYEIGDPRAYVLPDVVCDWSQVIIKELREDVVHVSGAKGWGASDTLKVCGTYMDGYRISCLLSIRGRDAEAKMHHTFDSVLRRVGQMLARRQAPGFTETAVEILGIESGYGPHARGNHSREVVGRLSARHGSPEALSVLLRELTSAGTSMAPGTTGDGANRPKPSPVVRLYSCLVEKRGVLPIVQMGPHQWEVPMDPGKPIVPLSPEPPVPAEDLVAGDCEEVTLFDLAHGRSGDKGNDANIGIIAREPRWIPILDRVLTTELVGDYFRYLGVEKVERYRLPGIGAWNFVLRGALGGGGMASLRQDPQGKGLAQILLDCPIRVPQGTVAASY